jgi:beta-lactamase class D OXA-10
MTARFSRFEIAKKSTAFGRVTKRLFRIALSALLAGCAGNAPVAPPTAAASPASLRSTPAPAITSNREIEALPALNAHFEAEHVSGTIALYDSAKGKLGCSNVALCEQAFIPASTFKIPNALIGLETGVVEDSETIFRWDGKQYAVADWNQDHTLRSAIRVSCVPCFQSIARAVGNVRMQEWINRFDYGNRDVSGGIDKFWLTGALRISPVQQIDFLRRLEGNKVPVSGRTREIVLDILALDVGPEHVLRGKTGLQREPEFPGLTAWFVGWVEIEERRVFFATLINQAAADVDLLPVRRRLTERILRAEGMLPG